MTIIPARLKKGDKVMIIAPSRSLKLIKEDCRNIAEERLNKLGLEVVFAPNTTDENCDLTISTDVKKRVDDIHTAFADKSVKAILTVIGGFNSNQLIKHLDYDLIKKQSENLHGFFGYYCITYSNLCQNRFGDILWSALQFARYVKRL